MVRLFFYGLIVSFSILTINGCSKNQIIAEIPGLSVAESTTIEIFHSQKSGDYKISIYHPKKPVPEKGWPVIYLLDGDSFFIQTVEIIKKQPNQVVVVAIDYLGKSRRSLDYLPNPSELTVEVLSNGKINIPEAYGGADNFLSFVQTELKPNLEQRFAINKDKQIIFGHSYGGLFVLHTLFTQSDSFSDYISSSPSIWFSGRYIMQEATQFIAQTGKLGLAKPINLQISVGEFEQSLTGQETFPSEIDKQLRLKHMQNRRMVDNTRELAEQLELTHIELLSLDYQVYQNQTHQSVPFVVLNHYLPILLQK